MNYDDFGQLPPFDSNEFASVEDAFSVFDTAYKDFRENYDPFDESVFNAVRFDDMRQAFDDLEKTFDQWTDAIGPDIYQQVGEDYDSEEFPYAEVGADRVVFSNWPLELPDYSSRGYFPSLEDAVAYIGDFGMLDVSFIINEGEYFEVVIPDCSDPPCVS